MKEYKKAAVIVLLAALVFLTGIITGKRTTRQCGERMTVTDTIRTVVVDTVMCYKPVARDSVVFRWTTRELPVKTDTILIDDYAQKAQEIIRESVTVELPITQKKYETEEYEAWVSGYEPTLDSICLYNKKVVEQIKVKEKAKRFGIGIVGGVGYGMTCKKADVFVGVGGYWLIGR